jgi:rSAM/selenodomain-associated transferase 1
VPAGTALVVMAKAPRAGYAKTRLIPALGAARAARLAERFLQHTLEQALAATAAPVTLSCAPRADDPAFARWAAHERIVRRDQPGGDLGARMAAAFASAFGQAERVLLFGTDAPALDAALLARAAHALQQRDAVFVPTLDGGYVLVGLARARRQHLAALFAPLPWSTPEVMRLTRERVAALGLAAAELEPLADVDEPADLARVPPSWLGEALDEPLEQPPAL